MSIINDLYIQLFGKEHVQDGNVIDMAEHGRVGGLSTGQPFKHTSSIDQSTGETINAPATKVQGSKVTIGTTPVELFSTITGTMVGFDIDTPVYRDSNNIPLTATYYLGTTDLQNDGTNAFYEFKSGGGYSIDNFNNTSYPIYIVCTVASQDIQAIAFTK